MKKSWFRPFGWIYLPISVEGWTVLIFVFLFCVNVFVAVDAKSHSVSDTLLGIFPYWAPALGIYLWIGSKQS